MDNAPPASKIVHSGCTYSRCHSESDAVRGVYWYLLHLITINAVLCLQVLGGSMFAGPVFLALQVIVIAPPTGDLRESVSFYSSPSLGKRPCRL